MADDIINLQYTTIKDPLPDFIYEGLKEYSKNANGYKPQPEELILKLAKRHNIPREMIYLTAGCDEAIQMHILAFGSNTYAFAPTYIVYKDASEFGYKFNEVFSIRDNTFQMSGNAIKDATLIFLANPNNPSGFTKKDDVMKLVENNSHAHVVIDEAYGDFADLSVIDKVEKYPNMSVLRSFSKGFSMAGNRIGYIITSPENIAILRKKVQWSNISYLSVGAAITALENEQYFINLRKEIEIIREDFMDFLNQSGYSFLPSKINAVVIKFIDKIQGTKFFEYLKENNIIASHGNGFSNIGLDESFVRLAIGNKIQMDVVKEVIYKYKK